MKPKLLLISAIPPFPQTSGGATRMYHTIKVLSKKYSVFFLTFNSENNIFYQKYTSKFINLDLKPRSLISPIPYRFSNWYFPELKTLIPQIIAKEQIDLIQVEFSQLLYLSDFIPKYIRTRFISHDISTISFYRRIFESKNIFKIITAFFFWLQIYFYEKKYLPRFNQIYTVSSLDQNLLKKYFGLQSIVATNGIEKIYFINKRKLDTLNLGYIGSFSHPPNKFAVQYFIKNIAPRLSNYQFYLAGNNPDFSDPHVINIGVIKDVKDFYQKIDVLIAPIFSGSGTRIKILEALSFGIPVITTPIGAEGLSIDSNYLQIAKNPLEFIDCLQHIPYQTSSDLKNQLETFLWSKVLSKYLN